MTYPEKYPFSVYCALQNEAKDIVNRVHSLYYLDPSTKVSVKVMIKPEIWDCIENGYSDIFAAFLGGAWHVRRINGRQGNWLCVEANDVLGFHYHAPLRVRPVRVYK